MRVVFLNLQHGLLKSQILDFIKRQMMETDIFCFQEVGREIFSDLTDLLTDFDNVLTYKKHFCVATFYKKGVFDTKKSQAYLAGREQGLVRTCL